MATLTRTRLLLLLATLASAAGCDAGSSPAADAAGAPDARGADAGVADAAPFDAAAPADAAAPDASPDAALDAAAPDAAPDAAVPDAAPDAAVPDAGAPLGGAVISRAFFSGSPSSWLVRIPLDGGPAQELTSRDALEVSSFEVTPDGLGVVFVAIVLDSPVLQSRLFFVPADGSHAPVDISGPLGEDEHVRRDLQLAPAGDRVAYQVSPGGRLRTSRLDGSQRASVSGQNPAGEWLWHPDGQRLVYTNRGATTPAGAELTVTCADRDCSHSPLPGRFASRLSFAPGGAHLSFLVKTPAPGVSALQLLDFPSEEVRELAPAVLTLFGTIVWSPDGSRLAYATGPATGRTLHIRCADGSCDAVPPLPPFDFAFTHGELLWSPDGQYLAASVVPVGNGGGPLLLRLFTLCRDGSCAHEHQSPGGATHRVWSSDGWLVHEARMPGAPDDEIVADCPRADCARVSVSAGARSFNRPLWAGRTPRLAFDTPNDLMVSEGVGHPPRSVGGFSVRLLGFDASGGRLLHTSMVGSGGEMFSVRIDGSDGRRLNDQLVFGARLDTGSYRVVP